MLPILTQYGNEREIIWIWNEQNPYSSDLQSIWKICLVKLQLIGHECVHIGNSMADASDLLFIEWLNNQEYGAQPPAP